MEIKITRASVVINTYNRADYLLNAVLSIAVQSHPDVELIVVNGPSTDATESVLDALETRGIKFKRVQCSTRNLSESRNIGIAASSGDVVFFIDDDAVAHREWIARIMRYHCDPDVAGVGGFTFDHTGVSFQCRYTVCDRFGNARFFETIDPERLLVNTSDFFFPSLLGTNCSFSMRALREIGGFDEVFAYMLDETDVCLRLCERGHRIVTVPNAYVFHKYAPSHTRTPERIPTSLLAPARSKVYYCLKHARNKNEIPLEVFEEVDRYKRDIQFANRWYLDHKKLSSAHYSKISEELTQGISEGLRLGTDPGIKSAVSKHLQDHCDLAMAFQPILPVEGRAISIPLRIYFVSQGYPPNDTSGIARWTFECARSLTALGHEVHVVTRSVSDASHVDFHEGVWVHSVIDLFEDELVYFSPVPIPASIACRAGAVLKEIRRSEAIWGVDVVSAPIWDIEGILCAEYLDKPVVTSLHTTYKLAMPFKPEWSKNDDYRVNHVNKVIAGENWLLENSVQILANSVEVIGEIDSAYGDILKRRSQVVQMVPHGLGDAIKVPVCSLQPNAATKDGIRLKILFVGRIEARKGPDQLLAALIKIPQILANVEVTFVGKSPDAATDRYVQEVNSLSKNLRGKAPKLTLKFLGHVSDEILEMHYANADIFIAPSRFESFGLILIEAMRHAVPVVACNIGGMREIIQHNVDGCLFDVDEIDELARILKALITDVSLRKKLGNAGKSTYEARFTSSVMGSSLEKFFLRVCERQ